MENKGNLLYKVRNDNLKNGICFTVLGILIFSSSTIFEIKFFPIITGIIFVGIGLFILLTKKDDTVIVYENGILISEKNNHFIPKKDIVSIKQKKIGLPITLNPFPSYYAVLFLNNQSQKRINIAYNVVLNTKYAKIIKSYLD